MVHSCFSCESCYGICYDNAVSGSTPTTTRPIKGCGMWAAAYPFRTIEIVPEQI